MGFAGIENLASWSRTVGKTHHCYSVHHVREKRNNTWFFSDYTEKASCVGVTVPICSRHMSVSGDIFILRNSVATCLELH